MSTSQAAVTVVVVTSTSQETVSNTLAPVVVVQSITYSASAQTTATSSSAVAAATSAVASTSVKNQGSGGLGTGAIVAIAVVIPVVAILAGILLFCLYRRRKNRSALAERKAEVLDYDYNPNTVSNSPNTRQIDTSDEGYRGATVQALPRSDTFNSFGRSDGGNRTALSSPILTGTTTSLATMAGSSSVGSLNPLITRRMSSITNIAPIVTQSTQSNDGHETPSVTLVSPIVPTSPTPGMRTRANPTLLPQGSLSNRHTHDEPLFRQTSPTKEVSQNSLTEDLFAPPLQIAGNRAETATPSSHVDTDTAPYGQLGNLKVVNLNDDDIETMTLPSNRHSRNYSYAENF